MKKSLSFRQLRLLALFAGCIGTSVAAPYGPDGRETAWTQPNGQVLQLRVFGDEFYGRTETTDGFSVYFNKADGTYYYASLGADKKSFVSSGTRADAPAPAGLEKHLKQGSEAIDQIIAGSHAKLDGERAQRWEKRVEAVQTLRNSANGARLKGADAAAAAVLAAPVVGNKIGLTLLVQFPNDPATPRVDPTNFPTNRDKIVRFCNNAGYTENGNTGSVRDYFYDQSLGALTYTQSVTQVVTLPHPRNYYNFSDYPANQELVQDISSSATEIISDAVAALKLQGFDFSGLSLNGDRVLATNVFFAGDDSGVWAEGLWPHQSSVGASINVGTDEAPIFIGDYQITNIADAAPVIGTFCHENGHLLLNYPDLYSVRPVGNTGREEQGVGEHCLMGSANFLNGGRTPAPLNAYFKELVGWGNITDLASDEFKTIKVRTSGNVAYRIANPLDSKESFIVENRGNGDKWAQYVPDKGIIIWHIDANIGSNITGLPHYEVAVMQADGRRDLEMGRNRGDGTDCFDLEDANFTDATTPNARWWDGSNSYIGVKVRSVAGAAMTVNFGALKPNTIRVISPNGGEVVFRDAALPVTWGANITGNVKIDLYKGGVFHSVITANHANDGSFTWNVPASLATTNDYSIRVSSLTNAVPAFDVSDASFSVSAGTFPVGNVKPYGWYKPDGADVGWELTKSGAYEGASCLATKKLGDGRKAGIAYSSNFNEGSVSFYIKVSTELGYDFARFYIDGEEQIIANDEHGISGNGKWVYASFPVSAGNHTFLWTYKKDDTYGDLEDTVWLDGVTLPATTQEIAIASPLGEEIGNGASTTVCPSVGVRYSASPVSFTIKNVGTAALTGIAVKTVGANSGDFIIQNLTKTVVSAGQSATFQVVFKPTAVGLRTTTVRVRSNDGDESDFDIALNGTGLVASRIGVYQASKALSDNVSVVSFGKTETKKGGQTKTVVVKNNGSAVLDNLAITVGGKNSKDFVVTPNTLAALAPGASASFKVAFRPNQPKTGKVRNAVLRIASNDYATGRFEVLLVGNSEPVKTKNSTKSAPAQVASLSSIARFSVANSVGAATTVEAASGVEVIDGKKYRTLTVTKNGGVSGTVEVSPNLQDWFSGKKYTTVLLDDATTLKVRDNTPFTSDSKRYIRLK